MKCNFILIVVGLNFVFAQICPPSDTIAINPIQNNYSIPLLNTWENLDIMTWNVKQFPLSNATIANINEVISDVLPDIILFQEINDLNEFENLSSTLFAYEFISSGDDYYGLAMAFRKDCIDLINYTTLFPSDGYEFAWRYPLKANIIWNCGDTYLPLQIINVHFKCCNDGFDRRLASSEILSDYINEQINLGLQENIIIGGDFNDEITDSENQNSLLPLVNNNNIYFTTLPIASNSYYDSFPSYNSFLDHIVISNNLYDEIGILYVNTLRLDDYMGYSYFQNNVSDHRPVTLSFAVHYEPVPQSIIINEIMNNPNAVTDTNGEWIEIYNSSNSEIINLQGYILSDNDNDYHIINSELMIMPLEYIILGINSDITENGYIDVDYEYNNFYLNNFWDEIIIYHPNGTLVDQVEYDFNGSFPNLEAYSMELLSPELDNNIGSNWVSSNIMMSNGDYGTPNNQNQSCDADEDINQDSIINVIDIIMLVNYITGESSIENFCEIDLNQDGNINVIDIVYLIGYILDNI